MNHRYISLGGACDVAMMFDILKLRKDAYPFDWLWNLNTGLAAVNEIIQARFAQICHSDSYSLDLHPRLGRNVVFYKNYSDILHLHSDPFHVPDDHATLVRRVSRFNEMLRSKDKLHFIYYANLGERQFFNADLTASGLIDEIIAEGRRFMSFMSRKGHGKRTTLLLVLQTDVEMESEAMKALSQADPGDERVRLGYTISRVDSSPELLKRWRRQWLDAITTKTDMPETMIEACRSHLSFELEQLIN